MNNWGRGGICFSFDDARGDFMNAYKILTSFQFPFTLNVTTGYVDKTSSKMNWPCEKEPLTAEQVKIISDYEKAEIALHGNDHNNDYQSMVICEQKLKEWLGLPPNSKLGCASPCGFMTEKAFYSNTKWGELVCYIRLGLNRINNWQIVKKLARKIGHLLPLPFLFALSFEDTIMHDGDDPIIQYSVPLFRYVLPMQVRGIIRKTIKENGYLVFMCHSIRDNVKGEDTWSYSSKRFVSICKYLKRLEERGLVKLCTSMEIHDLMSKNG